MSAYSLTEIRTAIEQLDPAIVVQYRLAELREAANRTLDFDWTERHVEASQICTTAAAAWFAAINTLVDQEEMPEKVDAYIVLFVSMVLKFQKMAADRMHEYLIDSNADGLPVDIEHCRKYLELQCALIGLKHQAGDFDISADVAAVYAFKDFLLQRFMRLDVAQLFLDVARMGQRQNVPEQTLDIYYDISNEIFRSLGITGELPAYNRFKSEDALQRVTPSPSDGSTLVRRNPRRLT